MSEQVKRIRELAQLRDEGILTETEFEAKKSELLGTSLATNQPSVANARAMPEGRGMQFGEAVKTCLSKYADFNGRATRSEYWFWTLFSMGLGISANMLDAFLMVLLDLPAGPAALVIQVAVFLPGVAVMVRRLHDTGRSGWWYFIAFTCIGIIPLMVFMCLESEDETNAYGPNPFTVPPLGGTSA